MKNGTATWSRRATPTGFREYLQNVRRLSPWVAAAMVLIALWPTVCMSAEGGPTTCQSAVFLPLPWGDSADTWGMVAAVGAAVVTYFALRRLLRKRPAASS